MEMSLGEVLRLSESEQEAAIAAQARGDAWCAAVEQIGRQAGWSRQRIDRAKLLVLGRMNQEYLDALIGKSFPRSYVICKCGRMHPIPNHVPEGQG